MTRPLVVAHRGSSRHAPEHTLAAYRRALADGAEALECDVRLTADGHLVLVHDRRINRTSNGNGVVSARSLSELARHDFSDWDNGAWDVDARSRDSDRSLTVAGDPVMLDDERRSILTLRRLLEVVTAYDRPVGLSIETKHPTRYRGYVEALLVELLGGFGLAQSPRVRVMSFSALAMRRVARLAPALDRVFLIDDHLARVWARRRPPFGAGHVGPSIENVRDDPGLVARMREWGIGVHVWTVDEDDDIDLCVRLGVSSIISNRPGYVLDRIG